MNLHYLSKLTLLNIGLIVLLVFSTQAANLHHEEGQDQNLTMGWQHQYIDNVPRMTSLEIEASADFPSVIRINLDPFSSRYEPTEITVYLNSSTSNHFSSNILVNHSSRLYVEMRDNISANDTDILGDVFLDISYETSIEQYWEFFTPGILLMSVLIILIEFSKFLLTNNNQEIELTNLFHQDNELVKARWKPNSLAELYRYHFQNFPEISFIILFLLSFAGLFGPHTLDDVGPNLTLDLVGRLYPLLVYGQILLVAVYVLFNFYGKLEVLFQNLTYPVSRKKIWFSHILTETLFITIVQLNFILVIVTYRYKFLLEYSISFKPVLVFAICSIGWLILSILILQISLLRLQDWRSAFLGGIALLVAIEFLSTNLKYWLSFRSSLNIFLLDSSGNIILYLLGFLSTAFVIFYISQASYKLVGYRL